MNANGIHQPSTTSPEWDTDMVNDIACPTCHSQDWVQSIPALRATGVSTVDGTGYCAGIGISSSGPVPVLGTTFTEQTRRTALATALAFEPGQMPTARPLLLGSVLVIPSLVLGAATLTNVISHPGIDQPTLLWKTVSLMVGLAVTFVLAIPTFLAFSTFRRRVRHNARVSRGRGAAFAVWRAGFYCHRCGVCYWPDPPSPHLPARYPFSVDDFRRMVWTTGGYAAL
ncbi:hypothetical protein NDR87_13565 [Nocardia sp. CDC159]|uniref:Uncharacterized protein n=1 Tax=Nocardia pulmonis TaxID=2951408 RepID=A0A9X2IWP4_9NOCA|nr:MULTISPECIES: hypothetical protein [Nocardia]MCM6774548.1 hypothetical protein [Nocardia pulmonis]MCM6787386.1 hypothetical protein [Nocardia sp. CDC159]